MPVDFRLLTGIPDIADKVRQEQAANADRAQRERAIQSQAAVAREGIAAQKETAAADRELRASEASDLKSYRDSTLKFQDKQFLESVKQADRAFSESQRQFGITAGFEDRKISVMEGGLEVQKGGLAVQQALAANTIQNDQMAKQQEAQLQQGMGEALKKGPTEYINFLMANGKAKDATAIMDSMQKMKEFEDKQVTEMDAKNSAILTSSIKSVVSLIQGMPKNQQDAYIKNAVRNLNNLGLTNLDPNAPPQVNYQVLLNLAAFGNINSSKLVGAIQSGVAGKDQREWASYLFNPETQNKIADNARKLIGDNPADTELSKLQQSAEDWRRQAQSATDPNTKERYEAYAQQADQAARQKAAGTGLAGVGDATAEGIVNKSAAGDVEKEKIQIENLLFRLENIQKSADYELLSNQSRIQQSIAKIADAWGVAGKDQKDLIRRAENFLPEIGQFFSLYAKSISGGSITQEEFNRMRENVINGSLSPTEFKFRLEKMIDTAKKELAFKASQLGRNQSNLDKLPPDLRAKLERITADGKYRIGD